MSLPVSCSTLVSWEVEVRRDPVVLLSNDCTACPHHFSLNRRTVQPPGWHADFPGVRISSALQLCASQSIKHLGAHVCAFLAAAYSHCWISGFCKVACLLGQLRCCREIEHLFEPPWLACLVLSCQVTSCYCFREFSTFCTQCQQTREDTSA